MDLLGCIILGLVTCAGGGTIRDVILNRPPFWIEHDVHLHIALWTSTFTFLIWPSIVARGSCGRGYATPSHGLRVAHRAPR